LVNAPTWKAWKLVDNIKIHLMEIECEDTRWMELAQYRVQWRALVSALLNLYVPLVNLVCQFQYLIHFSSWCAFKEIQEIIHICPFVQ
jgi:hypothetical protein